MTRFIIAIFLNCFYLNSYASIDKPDVNKTPGSIMQNDIDTICVTNYSKSVRNVSGKLKNKVYNLYDISKQDRGGNISKIDHLIPLILGGDNSITNLWPHYFDTNSGYGVLKKNKLELKLYRLVCLGKIDLSIAQECISKDWINCYNQHVNK